jgi:hypothetical protein
MSGYMRGMLFQWDYTLDCTAQVYIILLIFHEVHNAKELGQRLVGPGTPE